MKIIITEDYAAMSHCAVNLVQGEIERKPDGLISFPGGDTSVGMLELFTQRVRRGRIRQQKLKFVQLDDWVGIGPQDTGSWSNFIHENLLVPMRRSFADLFTFDGSARDIDGQLARQDDFICRYGPVDVEVLGIGMDGHLGFNESGVDFSLRSHRMPLSSVTKSVQKKYFGGRDLPLTEGITQGIAQIMESRLVIVLASGKQKADIVARALTGPVTNQVPASVLQNHPNCIFLLDRAAAAGLPKDTPIFMQTL